VSDQEKRTTEAFDSYTRSGEDGAPSTIALVTASRRWRHLIRVPRKRQAILWM